jgi:branched-chain amino acid transport system ATP-binding protein
MFEITDLVVSYGKAKAIKDISMRVDEGEISTIMGPNGAGKSTLLKAISGLLSVESGEIRFNGQRIDNLPPQKIVTLGVTQIPEGRRLFSKMNVMENLEMGATLQKDRKQIQRNLEWVFGLFPVLKGRSNQRAGTLSGGEQQMVAVGRALMAAPKLLLADEMSLGLAPIVIRHIFEVLREINKAGITIFLVEQHVKLALEFSTKGYLLDTGRIVLAGNARDLADTEYIQRTYLGKR